MFSLLLLLHLVLLAHASLTQSVYTMNSLPVSSEGWSLPGRPTMLPSDLVRLEHSFASKNLRFKCRKKTTVQRGSPSWIWQHGTEARTAGDAKAWWLCNQCWDKRKTVVYRIGTTHYPICHLRDEHRLSKRGPVESVFFLRIAYVSLLLFLNSVIFAWALLRFSSGS